MWYIAASNFPAEQLQSLERDIFIWRDIYLPGAKCYHHHQYFDCYPKGTPPVKKCFLSGIAGKGGGGGRPLSEFVCPFFTM